jgi:hypothetical protein
MIRELIGTLLVLMVFLVAWRVYRSVQRRKQEQQLTLPAPSPSVGGVELGDVFYASTVFAASPLSRVWAHRLGGRGKAKLFVSDQGVSLERVGEPSLLIPKADLIRLARASATIDKGVERDGLMVLHWRLGPEEVMTNLRVVSATRRAEIEDAIEKATGVKRG